MKKTVSQVKNWIIKNKEWLFSGIGITGLTTFVSIVGLFIGYIHSSFDDANKRLAEKNEIDVQEDVKGDLYQNSTIDNYGEEIDSTDDYSENASKNQQKELVIEINGEKVYPISVDIKDKQTVGNWVYFRYMIDETYNDETIMYPALFRYQENTYIAEQVNERACYSFKVVEDCVYYLDSTIYAQDHGVLYISRPDGKNERILDDELYDFQIVDNQYIYYTYRHDTVGVGLEGHALHRMNLDGSEIMIVAYEVSGVDMRTSHFDYKVKDGWIDCGTYKIEIGEPANGYERVIFKDIGDNEWIYYTTNRLIKARKDGSERIELDGIDNFYYEIEKIEGDWIYYIKGNTKFKIKKDGSGKETIIETQKDIVANDDTDMSKDNNISINDNNAVEYTNNIIENLSLGESQIYIEDLLGIPIFKFIDKEVSNMFYSLDLVVIRCIFDKNDSLIGYFVTAKYLDSKIEIQGPLANDEIIVFGENTFEPDVYPEAVIDGYVGMGGSAAINTYYWEYNYMYGVGLYRGYVAAIFPYGFIEDKSYELMTAAIMQSTDSQEIFDYRNTLHPNTIGIIDSNYKDIIRPYMPNDEDYNLWIECMMKLINDVQETNYPTENRGSLDPVSD